MRQYIILFLLLILYACQPGKESRGSDEVDSTSLPLIQTNCMSCHKAFEDKEAIAPSLAEIQDVYIKHFKNKNEAIKNLINFVNNPIPQNAIMKNAIAQYGLMPKLNYNPNDLEDISKFIVYSHFDQIDWEKSINNASDTSFKRIDHISIGQNIANETKMILGKNLLTAIKENGTEGALEFCNVMALSLTDSMSIALNAKVKRVSDKPRNSQNQANEFELAYIEEIKKLKSSGGNISPQMNEKEGKMVGYYPIETNDMCLKCHGKITTDIEDKTYTKIKSLYPKDKAHGYLNGQIRGIFVVEMFNNILNTTAH